jgi:hypothetical protein
VTGADLSAVDQAAELLQAQADPALRAIGAWLGTYPGALLQDVLGYENGIGRSVSLEARLAKRDAILGSIRVPVSRLAKEFAHYHTSAWLRDRLVEVCPYDPGDRRRSR